MLGFPFGDQVGKLLGSGRIQDAARAAWPVVIVAVTVAAWAMFPPLG